MEKVNFDLPTIRLLLYAVLLLFTFILFCISCARLGYTNNLPSGDSLNGGRDFYDPIVAEILVTTLMTIPWCLAAGYVIHKRYEHPNNKFTTFTAELAGLSLLWLFWIVGAAVSSSTWGDLAWCSHFSACRTLSALVAFSWLGWLTLTILLGITLMFGVANKAFGEQMHGRWDPHQSVYAPKETA